MTWVGETNPDQSHRPRQTQRVWKTLVNRIAIASNEESESRAQTARSQQQVRNSNFTGQSGEAKVDPGDGPSVIEGVPLDSRYFSGPRNRRTSEWTARTNPETISGFRPASANSFAFSEDAPAPRLQTVKNEVVDHELSELQRGDNDNNPKLPSDFAGKGDRTSPSSMPSLGTILSWPSTDFESTSRCSSRQQPSSSSTFPMPSLMSISSPDSTSTPTSTSPLTPDSGTISIPTIVAEGGEEKPASELTIDVQCQQENVQDKVMYCEHGSDNEVRWKAQSHGPATSSRLYSSFSPPRYWRAEKTRGTASQPGSEKVSSSVVSNHSSDLSPIGQEFLMELEESERGSQHRQGLYEIGESMDYSEATGSPAVAQSPSDDHYDARATRRRRRHSETSKLSYDGILVQLVDSMHGCGEERIEHLSTTLHTSNKGQGSTRVPHSRTIDDSTRSKERTGGREGSMHKEAGHLLKDYLAADEARASSVSPCRQPASLSRMSSKSVETAMHEDASHSKTKARRRHSGTSSVCSSSSSCESTRKGGSRHRRPPPPKQARCYSLADSLVNPKYTKDIISDELATAEVTNNKPSTSQLAERTNPSSSSGLPRVAAPRKVQDSGRLDHHGQSSSERNTRQSFASPVTVPRKLCANDLNQIRHSAPPRLCRIRSPRRRIIHIAHHFDMTRSRRSSSSSKSLLPLSQPKVTTRDQEARTSLSTEADPIVYEATTLSPVVPKPSPSSEKFSIYVDPKAKTVRHGNRTLDLIPDIADIKTSRRPSGMNARPERQYPFQIGLPPFMEDDDDDNDDESSSSTSSGSSHVSSKEAIYTSAQNAIHPVSPGVVLGPEMLPKIGESESSHVTLESDNFSLPITPRHRKPRVKGVVSESSKSCIPVATGHSSCSTSYIEPLVRIDHGFRGHRVDAGMAQRSHLAPSKDLGTRNSPECHQGGIPLALYLRTIEPAFHRQSDLR